MDFNTVEKERKQLLTRLVKALDQKELEGLLARSVAFRQGQVTYADYYRLLKKTAIHVGVSWKNYSQFDRYVQYVLQADTIRPKKLFQEIKNLERSVWADLIQTPQQKDARNADVDLSLLEKLVGLTLTPDEWHRYIQRETSIPQLSQRIDQIRGERPKQGKKTFAKEAFTSFELFYEMAEARNQALVDNILSRLPQETSKDKLPLGVFIAGGFHTDGLLPLLKGKATVIVASPKLENVGSHGSSDYLSVFTRGKTPLEELFESPQISLVKSPAIQSLTHPSETVYLRQLDYRLQTVALAHGLVKKGKVSMKDLFGLLKEYPQVLQEAKTAHLSREAGVTTAKFDDPGQIINVSNPKETKAPLKISVRASESRSDNPWISGILDPLKEGFAQFVAAVLLPTAVLVVGLEGPLSWEIQLLRAALVGVLGLEIVQAWFKTMPDHQDPEDWKIQSRLLRVFGYGALGIFIFGYASLMLSGWSPHTGLELVTGLSSIMGTALVIPVIFHSFNNIWTPFDVQASGSDKKANEEVRLEKIKAIIQEYDKALQEASSLYVEYLTSKDADIYLSAARKTINIAQKFYKEVEQHGLGKIINSHQEIPKALQIIQSAAPSLSKKTKESIDREIRDFSQAWQPNISDLSETPTARSVSSLNLKELSYAAIMIFEGASLNDTHPHKTFMELANLLSSQFGFTPIVPGDRTSSDSAPIYVSSVIDPKLSVGLAIRGIAQYFNSRFAEDEAESRIPMIFLPDTIQALVLSRHNQLKSNLKVKILGTDFLDLTVAVKAFEKGSLFVKYYPDPFTRGYSIDKILSRLPPETQLLTIAYLLAGEIEQTTRQLIEKVGGNKTGKDLHWWAYRMAYHFAVAPGSRAEKLKEAQTKTEEEFKQKLISPFDKEGALLRFQWWKRGFAGLESLSFYGWGELLSPFLGGFNPFGILFAAAHPFTALTSVGNKQWNNPVMWTLTGLKSVIGVVGMIPGFEPYIWLAVIALTLFHYFLNNLDLVFAREVKDFEKDVAPGAQKLETLIGQVSADRQGALSQLLQDIGSLRVGLFDEERVWDSSLTDQVEDYRREVLIQKLSAQTELILTTKASWLVRRQLFAQLGRILERLSVDQDAALSLAGILANQMGLRAPPSSVRRAYQRGRSVPQSEWLKKAFRPTFGRQDKSKAGKNLLSTINLPPLSDTTESWKVSAENIANMLAQPQEPGVIQTLTVRVLPSDQRPGESDIVFEERVREERIQHLLSIGQNPDLELSRSALEKIPFVIVKTDQLLTRASVLRQAVISLGLDKGVSIESVMSSYSLSFYSATLNGLNVEDLLQDLILLFKGHQAVRMLDTIGNERVFGTYA